MIRNWVPKANALSVTLTAVLATWRQAAVSLKLVRKMRYALMSSTTNRFVTAPAYLRWLPLLHPATTHPPGTMG